MDRLKQELILRRAICEVGKLLYERKLVVATDGNISIRLDKRNILITPAGFCKGFLSPPDIIRLPLDSSFVIRHSSFRDSLPPAPDPQPLPPRHQCTLPSTRPVPT